MGNKEKRANKISLRRLFILSTTDEIGLSRRASPNYFWPHAGADASTRLDSRETRPPSEFRTMIVSTSH